MFYAKEQDHFISAAMQLIHQKTDAYRNLWAGKEDHLNATLVDLKSCQHHFTVTKENDYLLFKHNSQPLSFKIYRMTANAVATNLAYLF